MGPARTLVIGTAGHIDHGKSRLVWALTGTDPDRLPEEKARGMTIELGFAHTSHADVDLSFVDVPGHERFIRTMVAGATGIDVALLVVAADDSVMPQTREHAEVLALLGVDSCVLVLTKLDLVDEEWAAQVEGEVRDLLSEVGLTVAGAVWTSSENGRGIAELRDLLVELAARPRTTEAPYRWFRLPIDRSFTIAGRGTVATGSVNHGALTRDTLLELWPAGQTVRVRDLQVHRDTRAAAHGRMRLGVNLAGIAVADVPRGCELATPGALVPTVCADVWLPRFRPLGKATRGRFRVRAHCGTGEVLAELLLASAIQPHTRYRGYAQLRPVEPIVAAWGQRFILRDECATNTLGGGVFVLPNAQRWNSRHPAEPALLETLRTGTPAARLAAAVQAFGWRTPPATLLATAAGLPDGDAASAVAAALLAAGTLQALPGGEVPLLIHTQLIRQTGEELAARLAQYTQANPRSPGILCNQWPMWMPRACPARYRPSLAEELLRRGFVVRAGEFIVPIRQREALPAADAALLEQALHEIAAGGAQPPDWGHLVARTPKNERRLRELLRLAEARGQLVRLADGLWLHVEAWQRVVAQVSAALHSRGALTVAEIRTLLGSSRKYVVPLVERLDAAGVTRRRGDERVLAEKQ